ncbi:MAG: hypothetical protein KGD73_09025 [Candidatus Lokiarchaeota archaeon]|nr:hypothetical protein [Candidatus Lokiarchaeota archaeon]
MAEDEKNHLEDDLERGDPDLNNLKDDLKTYLEEMESLETDFSDMDDLDIEEIQAMQDAIDKMREADELDEDIPIDPPISKDATEEDQKLSLEKERYMAEKESLLTDFSDLDEIGFDELKEMQEAMKSVRQEDGSPQLEQDISIPSTSGISSELEKRIQQELMERKEETVKEIISPEKFIEQASNKRDKIWYHALHYMVYQSEDHIASKQLLYEMLKEVTSKSPIDPILEHQFYFGLGYILRLTLNDKQIIRYMRGSKFKVNVSVQGLKELLDQVGEPISTRPVIKEEEKKQMIEDFLKDDFLDI